MEFFIELVGELFIEIAFQLVVELGWEGIAHSRRRRESANPFAAAIGYALLGTLAGALGLLILPHRFLPHVGVPGLSLLLGPLATGGLMHAYGERRRRRNLPTTSLATFWGGSMFAFFMALVRYVALGR